MSIFPWALCSPLRANVANRHMTEHLFTIVTLLLNCINHETREAVVYVPNTGRREENKNTLLVGEGGWQLTNDTTQPWHKSPLRHMCLHHCFVTSDKALNLRQKVLLLQQTKGSLITWSEISFSSATARREVSGFCHTTKAQNMEFNSRFHWLMVTKFKLLKRYTM